MPVEPWCQSDGAPHSAPHRPRTMPGCRRDCCCATSPHRAPGFLWHSHIRIRPREELPQRLDAVIGCLGKGGFFVAQLRDVPRLHCREPEIAGALTNGFEDPAPDLAGARRERLERGGRVILLAQPTHCLRHRGSALACGRRFQFAAKGTLIFRVKGRRAGHLGEADLWLPFSPKINSHIAVPVDILDEEPIIADAAVIAQPDLHRSSHSFFGPATSSSAANPSSSFIRSHTLRPSMRFGLGIRPSPTISSNFVTPTPIYSAAWTRESPRGARERGKLLRVFRTIDLCRRIDHCGSLRLPEPAVAIGEAALDCRSRAAGGLPHLIEDLAASASRCPKCWVYSNITTSSTIFFVQRRIAVQLGLKVMRPRCLNLMLCISQTCTRQLSAPIAQDAGAATRATKPEALRAIPP